MSTDFEQIRYDKADGIATITLNRPERMNAFTPRMLDEWLAALQDAHLDPETRVIILTAEGRTVHRVVFTREFLDSYGATMADRIPTLLDEWRLSHHLEHAGLHAVLVTSSGVRLADD